MNKIDFSLELERMMIMVKSVTVLLSFALVALL